MKALTRFFLSLKTTFGLFLAFIVLAVIGSVSLVNNLAFFSGVDDTPLFRWLLTADDPRRTWWIYLMIGVLAFMAINTIFCTGEAVLKKVGGRNLILKLAPQVMHLGVLFIMLGHLLTASAGFKADLNVVRGGTKAVTDRVSLTVRDIRVTTDADGYYTDWEAKLAWHEDGRIRHEGTLRPVHPLFFGPFGLYMRSVSLEPEASVLIRVSSDPGALWALAGGILLALGGVVFAWGRRSG